MKLSLDFQTVFLFRGGARELLGRSETFAVHAFLRESRPEMRRNSVDRIAEAFRPIGDLLGLEK